MRKHDQLPAVLQCESQCILSVKSFKVQTVHLEYRNKFKYKIQDKILHI